MNKGMIKSTFREVKTSFGRYMAMLLIVALGVGFFAGLKVAYAAMLYTGDYYLEEQKFFDLHLLSTLGFDEDTEKNLMVQLSDVKEKQLTEADKQPVRSIGLSAGTEEVLVEGSKSVDVLMTQEDGTELVIKAVEMPERINLPVLTAGRMPENTNECLVDEHEFDEFAIGTRISISDDNEEEDAEHFNEQEYTIVGLVRSPLYIMYQRGTTSVGDGSIDAYIYLESEAFDMDYDTDVYVYFDKNTTIYSEEYEDFINERMDTWEKLCQKAADSRYDRIYADALEEIEDADKTLQEKKEDGEKELSDAEQELADGMNQLVDGENEISKAKKTISDNEKTLKESEEEYRKGLKLYQKNKKSFDEGKSAYEQGLAEYNTRYAAYETNLQTYEVNYAAYAENEKQYAAARGQYEAGKDYLSEEEQTGKEQELMVWRAALDETANTLAGAKAQLDTAAAAFAESKATLNATAVEIAAGEKELAKAEKELTSAQKQIEDGKKQIESAKKEIATQERKLSDAKQELADGQAEYDDARQEYDEKINDAEEELADARQEIEDIEKPETYVMDRSTNAGYASFENDAGIIEGVSRVFPIFFFLVAALVCMTTMTRMMEEQRTQIGVLKALGYSNGSIIGKYITYSGSAAVVGAVVGFFAGTWTFSIVIWNAYKMMYDMGELHYIFKPGYAVISVLAALLCSAGTTFVCCYQELQEMAASLMRPKAPKVGKRVLLERVSFIWNRLKFLDKVSVRNLFRYKKRFFMMIVGVSGCTSLLITGMGIRDSIAKIADKQFEDISLYDLMVGIDDGEIGVEGIEDSMMAAIKSVDLRTDKQATDVNTLVAEAGEDFGLYTDLHEEDGTSIAFPKDHEVVISLKIAESYGIRVGDEISLQNSDLKGGNVTVSGIYVNYFNHYVIMTPGTYRTLFAEEPEYNSMFVNIEDGMDVYSLSSALMREDEVTYISVSEDVRSHISDMMKSLDYVVILVVVCAAMLAFIVIYNLNNINITERIREIATIKVLGFYKDETNSYVFRENIILTLLGSLMGVVLGHYLHAFVMSQIKIDTIAFDVRVSAVSFILSVILTLLFNQIVNLFMSKKLEHIDMAESLKSVE